MSKSFLLFFAVALLAITCLPLQGGSQQQPAPAPAAAPTPAPALNPPETEAPPPAAPVRNPVKPTAESQAKARTLYRMDCSMCHGDNGNGKTDIATSMELTLGDSGPIPKLSPAGKIGNCSISFASARARCPPESKGRATDKRGVWNLVIYTFVPSPNSNRSQAPTAPAQQSLSPPPLSTRNASVCPSPKRARLLLTLQRMGLGIRARTAKTHQECFGL